MIPASEKRFIRVNFIAIISLFFVVAAGGIVRSTGSGMGCPDWPYCFNRVIPPTDESQLPEGYEERYVEGRKKKNEGFARMMENLGFSEQADAIRHDESILVHEGFNAAKTWTEYANRLVGVIVGFCLLFTAFLSFTYWSTQPLICVLSVLNVILVGIQGWFGSIVVSTNLMPWIITVHMFLALVILAVSIYTYHRATSNRDTSIMLNHRFVAPRMISMATVVILLVQVVYGTEVRELVDGLGDAGVARDLWIDRIGASFDVHRILGYITMLIVGVLFFVVRSCFNNRSLQSKFVTTVLILSVVQMLSGIFLARLALPPFLQTTHLVVASLFFGAQFYLTLILGRAKL